mgnify:CR=1 FL=1
MDFQAVKDAIDQFAQLIKDFTKMIKDFVDSWKKEISFGEE